MPHLNSMRDDRFAPLPETFVGLLSRAAANCCIHSASLVPREASRLARRVVLALVPLLAAALLAPASRAAECTPDLTNFTPTPMLAWSLPVTTSVVGFRIYWKRAEDGGWRGSGDVPVWQGDANSAAVWPGITEPYPLQRVIPTSEVRTLIDVMVVSYTAKNVESAPSSILRICMPQIWTGGAYR